MRNDNIPPLFNNGPEGEFDDGPAVPVQLLSMMITPSQDRPFGMEWSQEKMLSFLESRGWFLITRVDELSGQDYDVVIKPGLTDVIPDTSNISQVFSSELQDLILKKLIEP